MSNKTRTRISSTTSTARALRPVPDQPTTAVGRTDTEGALWAALHAHPNSTAAELSTLAKIGKSTAGKILARWAGEGSVTRTPGIADGGRRAADVWAIVETDTTPAVDGSDSGAQADGAPADETPRDTTPTVTTLDDQTSAPTDLNPAGIPVATPAEEEDLTEPADDAPAELAPEATQDTTPADVEPEKSEPTATAPASTEASEPGVGTTPNDATVAASDDGKNGTSERLAPGALRGMVEDHLRDHPSEQFSPTAIAKALGGKSSGAVSNALDKLVADGVAAKTQDKPRRFALASAEQVAVPTN